MLATSVPAARPGPLAPAPTHLLQQQRLDALSLLTSSPSVVW